VGCADAFFLCKNKEISFLFLKYPYTQNNFVCCCTFQHDSNVGPLMSLLGVGNGIHIPFLGAVIFELHKIDGEHFVRLLYKNDSLLAPFVMKSEREFTVLMSLV